MKLNFTKKEVGQWLKKLGGNSAIVCAFRDWLAMYDLLKEDVYEALSNISMSIADLKNPSRAILEDKKQVIILIRKIRELIGEDK